MDSPVTYAALIARFPSLEAFDGCLGINRPHRNAILHAGRIPPARWSDLKARCGQYGVTISQGELEAAEIAYQAARKAGRSQPSLPLKRKRKVA